MREPSYMDNEPACGAQEDWPWGFLPCGCHNDGFGNHVHRGTQLPYYTPEAAAARDAAMERRRMARASEIG